MSIVYFPMAAKGLMQSDMSFEYEALVSERGYHVDFHGSNTIETLYNAL